MTDQVVKEQTKPEAPPPGKTPEIPLPQLAEKQEAERVMGGGIKEWKSTTPEKLVQELEKIISDSKDLPPRKYSTGILMVSEGALVELCKMNERPLDSDMVDPEFHKLAIESAASKIGAQLATAAVNLAKEPAEGIFEKRQDEELGKLQKEQSDLVKKGEINTPRFAELDHQIKVYKIRFERVREIDSGDFNYNPPDGEKVKSNISANNVGQLVSNVGWDLELVATMNSVPFLKAQRLQNIAAAGLAWNKARSEDPNSKVVDKALGMMQKSFGDHMLDTLPPSTPSQVGGDRLG